MIVANQNVSEHVLYSEVRCKCGDGGVGRCDGGHVRWEVLSLFERIRAECGRKLGKDCPIRISSGVRCKMHNIYVGGSTDSQHLKGLALDLHTPKGIGVSCFHGIADDENPDGGVGYYDWGVHIDARGERVRWGQQGIAEVDDGLR